MTVYGETVKGTGRSVEIGRSGGPGGSEEGSVDDRGKDLDTSILDLLEEES